MRNFTDITLLLDASASMWNNRHETISGVNKFITEQKAVGDNAALTLIVFNGTAKTLFAGKKIADVQLLTNEDYCPGGSTAYYDTTARAIEAAGLRFRKMPAERRPDKVLFVIMTDGQDTDSWMYGKLGLEECKSRIQHQRDKYSWDFAFLGANIDAKSVAATIGIPAGFSMNYVGDQTGTSRGLDNVTSSVVMYRSRVAGTQREGNFFQQP